MITSLELELGVYWMQAVCRNHLGRSHFFINKISTDVIWCGHCVCTKHDWLYVPPEGKPIGTIEAVTSTAGCAALSCNNNLLKCKWDLFTLQAQFLNLICPFHFHSQSIFFLFSSVPRACLHADRTFLACHNRTQRADNSPSTFSIRHGQPVEWCFPALSQGLYLSCISEVKRQAGSCLRFSATLQVGGGEVGRPVPASIDCFHFEDDGRD